MEKRATVLFGGGSDGRTDGECSAEPLEGGGSRRAHKMKLKWR